MPRRRWLPPLILLVVCAVGCSDGDGGDRGDGRGGETESSGPSASAPQAVRPPDSGAGRHRFDQLAVAFSEGPVRARTPAQVVEQIVASERAIADPATSPGVLAAAGHLQQLAYRQLGARPRWDAQVRRALPARLVPVVTANVRVRREFRSMHTTLSDTLPAWRIVAPAPAAVLQRHYRAAEARFGVGWEYLAAINLVETGMGRIRGTSVAGAQGPMQFIPSTWDRYGRGDINSPRDAIMAAARYLAASGFTRPRGRPGAIYSYNNHPAYVRGVTLLAQRMEQDPRAFLGYYHWQIYYLTGQGDVLLPEGYEASKPIPVDRWLARHPQR